MAELATGLIPAQGETALTGRRFSGLRPEPERPTSSTEFNAAMIEGELGNNSTAKADLRELRQRTDITPEQKNEILQQLSRIASTPLQAGLEQRKSEVLASLIQELVVPDSIHQDSKATCTVTEEERNLCKNDPARYARIMADLTTSGKTELFHGYAMSLNTDALQEDSSRGMPARALSMRVFQASAMSFAAETLGGGYDNYSDIATGAAVGSYTGLFDEQQQRLTYALRGQATERVDLNGQADDAFIDHLAGEVQKHGGVRIKVNVENGGIHQNHRIVIDRIEDGKVYFHNPWGEKALGRADWDMNNRDRHAKMEVMSVDELKECMIAAFIPVDGDLVITESASQESARLGIGVKRLQISPADFKGPGPRLAPLLPNEQLAEPEEKSAGTDQGQTRPPAGGFGSTGPTKNKEKEELTTAETIDSPHRDSKEKGDKSWFDGGK